MHLDPIALSAQEMEATTRASPTPPCGRSTTTLVAAGVPPRAGGTPTSVNQRFAEAAADGRRQGRDRLGAGLPAAAGARQMLRELRPDLRIGFFLHIPFPPAELFQQLPWRRQVLEGLLGADLVGFQRAGRRAATSSASCADAGPRPKATTSRCLRPRRPSDGPGARRSRSRSTRRLRGAGPPARVTSRAAADPRRPGQPEARCSSASTGSTTPRASAHRLKAFQELIADGALDVEDGLRPGRDAEPRAGRAVPRAARRDRADGRPDQRRDVADRPPADPLPAPLLPARGDGGALPAADVMVVTPLRDGMNLVAKEYVACRYDDDGALVLSEFAGAADELRQAWLVNPYDIDGMKAAILSAMRADPRGHPTPDAGHAPAGLRSRRAALGPRLPRRARRRAAPVSGRR